MDNLFLDKNQFLFAHIGLFLLIFFLVLFSIVLYRKFRIFKSKKFFPIVIDVFFEESFSAIIGFGFSVVLVYIIKRMLPNNNIDNSFYVCVTLVFYIILSIWYRKHQNGISKSLINEIKKENKKSIYYRNAFDLFLKIDREKNNSYLIDRIVKDYTDLGKNIFLLSNDGYLGLLKDLMKKEYSLFGINNVLPPYWLSPKYPTNQISTYSTDAKEHKNKITRINYFKSVEWKNNTVKEILQHLKENPNFGVIKTYCWYLFLLKKMDENSINVEPKYLAETIELHNISIEYLNEKGNVYNILINNEKEKIVQLLDNIIADSSYLTEINTEIETYFEANFGNTTKILKEELSEKKQIKRDWVELMLAEKGKHQIGMAILHKNSIALKVEVIENDKYNAIKQQFEEIIKKK